MSDFRRNAADRKQKQIFDRWEREDIGQWKADLKVVLGTPVGRRVFQHLLDELQPRRINMWAPSAAIQMNAVRHDVGNWIKQEIDDVDIEILPLMLAEQFYHEKQRRLEVQALAVNSPANEETEVG